MAYQETMPGALSADTDVGAWTPFRLDAPDKRLRVLREICQGQSPVSIGPQGGPVFPATLWSVDATHSRMLFKVETTTPTGQRAMPLRGLWGATYQGDTKLQFPLSGVTVEPTPDRVLLHADLPRLLFKLPRRQGLRLRKEGSEGLVARLHHPLAPDLQVELRVLDLSATGCALWRPIKVMPLVPDQTLRAVEIVQGDETLFFADLDVRHASPSHDHGPGMRIGCTWATMSQLAKNALGTWIAAAERRRGRFTLDFG